jgi:hypothetical protein
MNAGMLMKMLGVDPSAFQQQAEQFQNVARTAFQMLQRVEAKLDAVNAKLDAMDASKLSQATTATLLKDHRYE